MNPADDLHARWRPSPEQIVITDALLNAGYTARRADGEYGVYTGHLLLNKDWGSWTADVRVLPLDGVFLERDAMSCHLQAKAECWHAVSGERLTAGYTWHRVPTRIPAWPQMWAVFEDIMSQFPER